MNTSKTNPPATSNCHGGIPANFVVDKYPVKSFSISWIPLLIGL